MRIKGKMWNVVEIDIGDQGVVKWTHQVLLVYERKEKVELKKRQINLCLRKHVPFCHLLWRLLRITMTGKNAKNDSSG